MPTEADQTESSYNIICYVGKSIQALECIVKILPVVSIPVQITTGNK